MKTIPIIGPILSAFKAVFIALVIATVLFVLFKLFSGQKSRTNRMFLPLILICIVGWTIFINSYWADTGYYDSVRIPLGNDKEIVGSLGQGSAEINTGFFKQEFTAFVLTDSIVYGMLDTGNDTIYIVYPISEKSVVSFETYSDYLNNTQHPEPLSLDKFKSFEKNYYDYWGKLLWLY